MAGPLIGVVEDDPILLPILEELLTEEGYAVIAWRQAAGTADQVCAARPALVLLDIRLEDARAGMRLLEELQAAPCTRDLPLIVTSADGEFLEEQTAALRARGCWVLPKPFDLDDLLALLDKLARSS